MDVHPYAKINWSLRVTGRRADGFHDLETIFQSISLHDTLTFTPASELSLTCDDPSIPTDETNLVLRAARALGAPPVAIHLQKRIPAGGGLGGGSSNAAATLVTLARLFALDTPLAPIALQLGSDVPFFLLGGTAYATGRGEVLTPLPSPARTPLLLLMPEERVMTGEAFAGLRQFSPALGIDAYRALLAKPEVLVNDFEPSVFAKLPRLGTLKARLRDEGAVWSGMSGSGSTIVAAFADARTRDAAAEAFAGAFAGVRAVTCETR
jgi:4-diphosphocytidyl-2-C-methyl-D-erythritol kinase